MFLKAIYLKTMFLKTSRILTMFVLCCCHFFADALLAADLSGDNEEGGKLYQQCAGCHGQSGEGNPQIGSPAIAAQQQAYLIRQLQQFQSGARGGGESDNFGAQMKAVLKALDSDTDIADVSAYIARMKETSPPPSVGGNMMRGNTLYQGNCGACHGGQAQGNALLNTPRLAGLELPYVLRQIAHFKSGRRGSETGDRFGQQMRLMADTVASDTDLKDIVFYIHSLQL
jgi:cytochrome c553